uniref:(California timema) hypothetical protein n=1 Tax=Timema californicum TaxID=61474 RepID=A0A7R9JDL0_TIMCA|nr:unnamed protein product [Timema californicum]
MVSLQLAPKRRGKILYLYTTRDFRCVIRVRDSPTARRKFVIRLFPRTGVTTLCADSLSTLRQWLPQIFATMQEYTHIQESMNVSIVGVSLCDMLEYTRFQNTTEVRLEGTGHCSVEDRIKVKALSARTPVWKLEELRALPPELIPHAKSSNKNDKTH